MPLIELLFLATGFTGAVTLLWLARIARDAFVREPALAAHFGPGLAERIAKEIAAARREVLLLADGIDNPAILQALLDARERKLAVEVVLGPAAEPGSLQALIAARPVAANALLLDGQTLLLASEPFADDGCLTVATGHAGFLHSFREQILAARAPATAPVEPRPVPVYVPASAPAQAVVAPQDEAFSYSFNPPTARPADDMLASVAKPAPPLLEDDEEEDGPAAGAPTVTLAAADLFARLRREVAGARSEEPAA